MSTMDPAAVMSHRIAQAMLQASTSQDTMPLAAAGLRWTARMYQQAAPQTAAPTAGTLSPKSASRHTV